VGRTRALRRPAKRLLREVDPDFAAELAVALRLAGEEGLAARVFRLVIEDSCGCTDPGCASFYAVPRLRARSHWIERGRTIELACNRGRLSVDVADSSIVAVEVLGRPELRSAWFRSPA